MTFVGLLRHGEVEGGAVYRGRTDDPLNATGWTQMRAATDGLRCWDHVIASPLQRCAAFAEALAREQRLPLALDAGLAEIDFGDWEGRSAEELMAQCPDALADFWSDPGSHPPPGGESLSRFQRRVVTAWESLYRRHAGKRLLLVTHGGVIRMLLCHLQDWPLERLLRIEVGQAALFGLQLEEGRIKRLFTSPSAIRGWMEQEERAEGSLSAP